MSDAPGPQKPPPLILVADDVASARLLYGTVLTSEGYRVVEARDGMEALERIRTDGPDLAILDISMPRMDGMQVLGALRRSGNNTPVLVITAHKDRETVLAAAQRGIVSYLTKPINIVDFRERVRRTLLEHGVERPETPASAPVPHAATPLPSTFDPETMRWLESAPTTGWSLTRLDEFLQAGEDLGALVTSIAQAADAPVPHEPTRADRIAQCPVPIALAKLQVAFERGDEGVKLEVIDLVPAQASEEQKVRHLSRWGQDAHARVRSRVVSALADLRSPAGVRALLPLFRDPEAGVRRQATEAVEAHGWLKILAPFLEDYAAAGWEIPEGVCERLLQQPSGHVLERLRGMNREGDAAVRAQILRLVAKLGWPEGKRLLESALGDPEATVRAAAVAELCKSHDRKSSLLLLDVVTDPDPQVVKVLSQHIVNASLKLDTRRIIARALSLSVEVRLLFPELLSRLEESEEDLQGLLLALIRGDEGARDALLRLAKTLGFKESLPPGPVGPVVAKAFAEHLAALLLGKP